MQSYAVPRQAILWEQEWAQVQQGARVGAVQQHLGGAGQALAGGRAAAAVIRQSALQPRSRSMQRRLTAHMHTYAMCTSNKCVQGTFLEGKQY